MTQPPTTDLLDAHPELACFEAPFLDLGGTSTFAGWVRTVRCRDDNTALRDLVATPGDGSVIVVDAGGTRAMALVGDRMARTAADSGWAGIVVDGAVRDRLALREVALGVRARAVVPRRSRKDGDSEVDVPVVLAGVPIEPGAYLWSDADGIVVATQQEAARIVDGAASTP